ncbi:MAG: hypothetical protein L0206_02825 [Actinobacteria bacterium]|nr:hypothetical protein [Actinomycetota bacterium]
MASPNVPANTLSPFFSTGIPNICDRSAPRSANVSTSASNRFIVSAPGLGIFGGVLDAGMGRMLPRSRDGRAG